MGPLSAAGLILAVKESLDYQQFWPPSVLNVCLAFICKMEESQILGGKKCFIFEPQ